MPLRQEVLIVYGWLVQGMKDNLEGMGSAPELHFKWVVSHVVFLLHVVVLRNAVTYILFPLFLLTATVFCMSHSTDKIPPLHLRGSIFYHLVDFYNHQQLLT